MFGRRHDFGDLTDRGGGIYRRGVDSKTQLGHDQARVNKKTGPP